LALKTKKEKKEILNWKKKEEGKTPLSFWPGGPRFSLARLFLSSPGVSPAPGISFYTSNETGMLVIALGFPNYLAFKIIESTKRFRGKVIA